MQGRTRTATGVLSAVRSFGIGGRVAASTELAFSGKGEVRVSWDQTEGAGELRSVVRLLADRRGRRPVSGFVLPPTPAPWVDRGRWRNWQREALGAIGREPLEVRVLRPAPRRPFAAGAGTV